MHFKPFWSPFFPYSITSILSKVRNSNTLFLTIILNFLNCHSWGGGGGGGMGDITRNFFLKNLCLWECISSHFEAHFPYSITSILSEVRNSNTLFLTIILHFLVIRGLYGGPPPDFLKKIYVSITSILSKVTHSNTLFLTIILHFLVIRVGYGGPPPEFFFKSMSLRINFKPFWSSFFPYSIT